MANRLVDGHLPVTAGAPVRTRQRTSIRARAGEPVVRQLEDVGWLAAHLGVSYSQALRRVQQGHIFVLRLGRRIYVPVAALGAMAELAIQQGLGADAQLVDPKK